MKYFAPLLLFILAQATTVKRDELRITKNQLLDKIMGGWAGQTVGASLSAQILDFDDSIMHEHQLIRQGDGYLAKVFENNPELFDEFYMDLAFTKVIENEGLTPPVASFTKVYSEEAEHILWHANQIARYNILHGIAPPASGHWLNNPHADDTDFMIAADFAGLMSPGMPRTASEICEKVGHIMTYGDGYYGGVYIANLYSLAFTSTNIDHLIREAMKSIPERSGFYNCIKDVIKWHKENPDNWEFARTALQKKWSENIACPGDRFGVADIDAKLNGAYITLALLYGGGDFTKTLEIITDIAQNSECSPSSCGGILGTLLGYDNLPDDWMQQLKDIEVVKFKYTAMSLHDVYRSSFDSALKNIEQNGGKVRQENIVIMLQQPVAAKFEKSFAGHYATEKRLMENGVITDQLEFEFEGIGFVLRGEILPLNNTSDDIIFAELYLNNKFVEKAALAASYATRRSDLFWKFQLPHDKYKVKVKILNPSQNHHVMATGVVVYDVHKN